MERDARALSPTAAVGPRWRTLGLLALWGWAAAQTALLVRGVLAGADPFGSDSFAYWAAWHRGGLYTAPPGAFGAFLYSPVFAWAVRPLAALPLAAFVAAFTALDALSLAWLVEPCGWLWGLPLWALGLPEVVSGNVGAVIACGAVLGLRGRPWGWAFGVLTKVTPGLGLVWLAGRRQWRELAAALAVIVALVLVVGALDPGDWAAWVRLMVSSSTAPVPGWRSYFPLWVRLVLAVSVVLYASRTGRSWLVPVALLLAYPVLWVGALTLLAAIPRLVLPSARPSASSIPV